MATRNRSMKIKRVWSASKGRQSPRCKHLLLDRCLLRMQTAVAHTHSPPELMMGGLAVTARAGAAVLELGTTPREAVIAQPLARCSTEAAPRRGPAQGRASYQRKQGRKGQLPVVGMKKDTDKFPEERSKTREWGTWGCA